MADPLDLRALLALVSSLAPSVHGSSPLQRPTDAAVALVHAIHTGLGFRLVPSTPTQHEAATGVQDEPTEADAGGDDDARSETTTAVDPDEGQPPENVLPASWNARGEDSYMFEYRHAQSAMTFRVRVGRMGNRIQVDAMPEVSSSLASGRDGGRDGQKGRLEDGLETPLCESGCCCRICRVEQSMFLPRRRMMMKGPGQTATPLPYHASAVQLTAHTQDGAPHTISLLVNDLLDTSAFPIPPGQAANAEGDARARAHGFRSLDACVSIARAIHS